MNFTRLSLRTIMIIFLVLMSMLLVLVSWEVYRDSALDSQRRSLTEMLERESGRVMEEMRMASEEMVMLLQSKGDFRKALAGRDARRLAGLLDAQFDHPQVNSGTLELVQLYAYDDKFQVIAWSHKGPSATNALGIICRKLVDQAGRRSEADLGKVFSGLCQWKRRTYFSMIVPVGDDQPQGYLQVITDPLQTMSVIERDLQLPMNVTVVNGDPVYRSHRWRAGSEGQDFVTAHYRLIGNGGQPLAQISMQRDLTQFNNDIDRSRNELMVLAGVITLLMVMFALWVLHRAMVRPIRSFTEQLDLVRRDRRNLGKSINVPANVDLRELMRVFNEMSLELAHAYEEYEDLAFTDQLTALPNRALFLDRLKQMILLSKRKSERFGVMLLDLDGFKEVNDTLGHRVGDELLKHIAQRLQRIIRASSTIARVGADEVRNDAELLPEAGESTVARLGGDEFAILLPNLGGVEGAVSVAKRVVEVLETPAEIDGNMIVVAGTLGIAMFPEHGDDAETLLRRTDVALYVAKHLQSDYSVYDPAYDRHSVKQLALKAELRTAIEEDQLQLYFQPKLDLNKGCVTSVEALVRWNHPQQGIIPPGEFIPLSEQRGLIGPLTEWVIRHSLAQHKRWQEQGIDLKIAVNLSSRVLYDLSLPAKIEKFMVNAKLSPAALALEITEEATMLDPQRALVILQRLAEMGISLSIDDFGTGHSSLSYLKRLPVDEIKIDRSFVMEMETSDNDAKIVHATIDLAHNLGLGVVAEGVESEQILKMLKALNCDFAQGYYLSRPVPEDEFVQWLAEAGFSCGI
jgi:predicted signal transduction protein with EAL and GGDEF domain